MGASISRLQQAGGNAQAAKQMLIDEFNVGAHGWSPAQKAAFANPSTRDAWLDRQIQQSTKGKYHGVLGKIGKAVETVAPIAALAIPGLSPAAAAALAAGGSAAGRAAQGKSVNVGKTLVTGAAGAAGNAALHGRGVEALIGNPATSGAAASAAGGGGGILHGIVDYVGKHPLDAAQIALAGLGTVQGAKRAGQADQLRQKALAGVNPDQEFDLGLPAADASNPYADPTTTYRPSRARRAALASLGY